MKQLRNHLAAFLFLTFAAIACQKENVETTRENPVISTELVPVQALAATPVTQSVTFQNASGLTLTGRLVVPSDLQANEKLPAMVIMHGCGGMWSNDNPANGMKTNFNEWATLLSEKRIIALFVDSYVPRGLVEFCERNPTNDTLCSPAYERPKDAYAGLAYLKTLNYVDGSRVGLMGFSHGGSATVAAIVNHTYVAKSLWTVSYKIDSTTTFRDTVPAPVARPASGGFKTAIAYYPGAGFFGYFGSTTDKTSGKYLNYAPTLVLGAKLDKLLPATEVLVEKAKYNGASTSIELVSYNDANHSFDEAKTGSTAGDIAAKAAARTKVLNWLDTKL